MIAHHIDKLLCKGQGSSSDEVFNEQLDAALGLYCFTEDKDVFRTFYHHALAKRLLLGSSVSEDAEKAMLKKLKEGAYLSTSIISWRFNTLPVTQTMTLNGMGDHMFRDLTLSRDAMAEYHACLGPGRAIEQKLTTMVLQQSFWLFSSG
jgi:cullin 4